MLKKQQLGIILSILVLMSLGAGWVASKWYWSTQSFTYTVVVDGSIDAKSNFMPSTILATGPLYEEIETVDTLLTVNGGESQYLWIILSPTSDFTELYCRVMVECPDGGSCIASVWTQSYTVSGGSVAPVLVSSVAIDGSEIVQIERDGDSRWMLGSVFGVSYRFMRIQLDFDNSLLEAGSHDYIVRVELGDGL